MSTVDNVNIIRITEVVKREPEVCEPNLKSEPEIQTKDRTRNCEI